MGFKFGKAPCLKVLRRSNVKGEKGTCFHSKKWGEMVNFTATSRLRAKGRRSKNGAHSLQLSLSWTKGQVQTLKNVML